MTTVLALSVAIILGGGTAFAAEHALPGDTLYPVKVHVNEEMRAAISWDDLDKAAWETRRVERRVEEIDYLMNEGRLLALPPHVRAQVEARLEHHEGEARHRLADLSSSEMEPSVVITNRLQAALHTHADLVTRLEREGRESERTEHEEDSIRTERSIEHRGNIEVTENDTRMKTQNETETEAEINLDLLLP